MSRKMSAEAAVLCSSLAFSLPLIVYGAMSLDFGSQGMKSLKWRHVFLCVFLSESRSNEQFLQNSQRSPRRLRLSAQSFGCNSYVLRHDEQSDERR